MLLFFITFEIHLSRRNCTEVHTGINYYKVLHLLNLCSSNALGNTSMAIFFAFSLSPTLISRESIVLGQIFEVDILMDLNVLRLPETENHIFSGWSVYTCVCLCICYQHNLKTNNSKNFKFGIIHLYHTWMLLETFYKDRIKTLCTGTHKRILKH